MKASLYLQLLILIVGLYNTNRLVSLLFLLTGEETEAQIS